MSIIQGVGSGEVSTGFYPFTISNSLRFNAGDDPFLSRTPSAASNRKTWTWSAWVKRATIDNTVRELFGTAAEGDVLRFTDSRIGWFNNGSASSFLSTSAFFRDPSAWYNIVLAFDTTESTDSDRVKLYVNGTQVAFDNNNTFPGPSYEGDINNTEAQFIGKGHGAAEFDGYLAEINFIDGQALGPSSFGETKNDIWVASTLGSFTAATTTVSSAFSSGASSITVSSATGIAIGQQVTGTGIPSSTFVTNVVSSTITLSQNTNGSSSGNYVFGDYGRNGFRLQFLQSGTGTASSSTLGADTSGNGHHFTSSNLASTDQMLDSPSDNHATLNSIHRAHGTTLSNGSLDVVVPDNKSVGSTIAPISGKWYAEVTVNSANFVSVGVCQDSETFGTNLNASTKAYMYSFAGIVYKKGSSDSNPATFGATDKIGIFLDLDNHKLYFKKNNTGITTSEGQHAVGSTGISIDSGHRYYFAVTSNGNSADCSFNFGQTSFTYSPDGGHEALNTSNLPDPAIDPNNDETPDQYFDSQKYTGNGSTKEISSFSFQPDWVWIKNRVNADDHYLYDSVRGATKTIHSNGPSANAPALGEFTSANALQSFDNDGFTTGGDGGTNRDTQGYVAWAWKAGTSQSFSSESGTLDSTVSSSSEAGFSIVKYTGGSDERVKHGMGTGNIPEMILVKDLSATSNWAVYHIGLSANHFLELSTNGAQQSGSNPRFQGTGGASVPTDTYFFVNNYSGSTTNATGNQYIAYCFLSLDGYSKMGAWTNNGSTDGTFIFTGFRPAFILLKNFDNSEGWYIIDNRRSPLNIGPPLNQFLGPNLANIEGPVNASTATIDLLANGFKIRTTNTGSGEVSFGTRNYIYMAFADQPLKYSNAR